MQKITLNQDKNNVLACKTFAILREASTWQLDEKVEVFFKKDSKGIYKIESMYRRENINDTADHLYYLAYGENKTKTIEKIKNWYYQQGKNINQVNFQWLILTKEEEL